MQLKIVNPSFGKILESKDKITRYKSKNLL